jgi:hypothetical protein
MVSPVHGDYRRCQAETPLSDLFKFAEPALLKALSEIHLNALIWSSCLPWSGIRWVKTPTSVFD